MSNVFNDAQLALLEDEFQRYRRFGQKRPPRSMSATICCRASMLGASFVSSQEVGRWFENRAKHEDGEPRAKAKTSEQLALLEDSFAQDPYPDVDERARLVLQTLLKKSQVDAWFCRQRNLRPAEVDAAGYPPGTPIPGFNKSEHGSVRFWKDVEKERQALVAQQEDSFQLQYEQEQS